MHTYRTYRGFTLIELLVVIAIIGLLSTVVLASLEAAREKARDARRLSDMKQLQLAFELFYDDNGQYPDDPVSTRVVNLNTSGRDITPYINPIPTDPEHTGSNGYRYRHSDTNGQQSYTLLVRLEANNDNWCSVNRAPGHTSWNGISSDGGGSNYPPCF